MNIFYFVCDVISQHSTFNSRMREKFPYSFRSRLINIRNPAGYMSVCLCNH